MGASYFICIAAAISSMFSSRLPRYDVRFPNVVIIPGTITLCVIITTLFAFKTTIVNTAAHTLAHPPPYIDHLPLRTIRNNAYENEIQEPLAITLETISIIQTSALFALAFLLRVNSRHTKTQYFVNVILAATALILTITALHASSIESEDIYLHVGLAEATPTPYHPGSTPLSGDSAVINLIWGLPLFPSAYGPLWIILSKIVTMPLTTLAHKLFALRCLEAAALMLCAMFLCVLKLPCWTIAIFAVNPTIYDLFVSEGHNDLVGTTFILAASAVRRKSLAGAILLTVAAGMIKLPFILIGSLVFAAESTLFRRAAPVFAAAGISLVLSFVMAGSWYAWALRYAVHAYEPLDSIDTVLHTLLIAIAVGALFLAVARQKFIPGAAWSMPAFGLFLLPWYLAWSLPYALLSPRPNLIFLATLPIAAYLFNVGNAMTSFFILLRVACVAVPIVLIVIALLRRRHEPV